MAEINSVELGAPDAFPVVFAHGWGRTHKDLIAAAELVADRARPILLDLPGFGQSPRPEGSWSTDDYATAIREHLAERHGVERCLWVGHSFGGRVGLRLAARAASPVEGLIIVAGAGVKAPRPRLSTLKGRYRGWEYKRKKAKATSEDEIIALEKQYGSPDYVQSREIGMRDIFVKTVQEDQSDILRNIACPTVLIYGGKDTETPPAVGRLLHAGIRNSTYIECPEFDHLSILTRGRHQIATLVQELLARGDA